MKAAVLKKARQLVVEDVPVPALGPDEVLVRVAACGICGSDLRYFEGENPWALHTLGVSAPNPPNIILGHEFAGEVVDGADDSFRGLVGRRVVVSPYRACGLCALCRSGRYNLCRATVHLGHGAGWGEREYYPGGMAEYCPVWADKAYVLPDHVSYDQATLLDIAGVGLHAVRTGPMPPHADVAVLGAGPLGLCILQIARTWGANRTFCTDVYEKPLSLAREWGAVEAIVSAEHDPADVVLDRTGGVGVDMVFDTVGTSDTQRQGLRMLAPGGTLVNLVTNRNKVSFELLELAAERCIRTSTNYFFHDFQTAIDLTASGRLDLSPMITHRFPLAEVEQAFRLGLHKQQHQALKIVIDLGNGQ